MIDKIDYIINKSWNIEFNNKSIINSLILNNFMGGKIMKYNNIYFNIVNDKVINISNNKIDIINSIEIKKDDILLDNNINNIYLILLKNVKDNFMKYGTKSYKLINSKGIMYTSKIPGTIGGNKKLKIYGKLDCPSALRYIKKGQYINNRVFFDSEKTAIQTGYRPCAKCMHKEYIKWKENNNVL